MELQQFGEVSGLDGPADLFLSIDEDKPDEYFFSVLPKASAPFSVLATGSDASDGRIELKLKNYLRPGSNGGLIFPVLSDDEKSALRSARLSMSRSGSGYSGEWSAAGRRGTFDLKHLADERQFQAEVLGSWADYKQWAAVASGSLNASLFRGHGDSRFDLKTTLHRAGRNRLDRYCSEILPRFHAEVEGELGLRLDMANGADYSVVLGLAQHHGLPTPMLDWTASPYVAAFFAFADALEAADHRADATHVRIFALTRSFVDMTSPPSVVLTLPGPFVSSLSISSRHNARLRAQQGRFIVTNVASLGAFLRSGERKSGERFLYAVDVPVTCAREALEDLAFMGLTAATMFPGLDGVCRSLRHEMSFKRSALGLPGLPAPTAEGLTPEDASANSKPPQSESIPGASR